MCNNPYEFSCAAGATVQAAGGLVLWPQHSGTLEGSIYQASSTGQTDPRRGERTNHTDVEGREKSMGRMGAKPGREIVRGVFKCTSLFQRHAYSCKRLQHRGNPKEENKHHILFQNS